MTQEQENLRLALRAKRMSEYEEEIVAMQYGKNAAPNLSGNDLRQRSGWSKGLSAYRIFVP